MNPIQYAVTMEPDAPLLGENDFMPGHPHTPTAGACNAVAEVFLDAYQRFPDGVPLHGELRWMPDGSLTGSPACWYALGQSGAGPDDLEVVTQVESPSYRGARLNGAPAGDDGLNTLARDLGFRGSYWQVVDPFPSPITAGMCLIEWICERHDLWGYRGERSERHIYNPMLDWEKGCPPELDSDPATRRMTPLQKVAHQWSVVAIRLDAAELMAELEMEC